MRFEKGARGKHADRSGSAWPARRRRSRSMPMMRQLASVPPSRGATSSLASPALRVTSSSPSAGTGKFSQRGICQSYHRVYLSTISRCRCEGAMRIVDVEALYLRMPEIDESRTDSSQDALLIRIRTDAGITGWGEVDGCPAVGKAIIEAPVSHPSQGSQAHAAGRGPFPDRVPME